MAKYTHRASVSQSTDYCQIQTGTSVEHYSVLDLMYMLNVSYNMMKWSSVVFSLTIVLHTMVYHVEKGSHVPNTHPGHAHHHPTETLPGWAARDGGVHLHMAECEVSQNKHDFFVFTGFDVSSVLLILKTIFSSV